MKPKNLETPMFREHEIHIRREPVVEYESYSASEGLIMEHVCLFGLGEEVIVWQTYETGVNVVFIAESLRPIDEKVEHGTYEEAEIVFNRLVQCLAYGTWRPDIIDWSKCDETYSSREDQELKVN